MSKSQSYPKKKVKEDHALSTRMDDIFDNFRRDMENVFSPWRRSVWDLSFPRFSLEDEDLEIRLPLCDLVDKGDKYEISIEIPGIDKEKIKINAKKNSIMVSGEQTEKKEEKKENYIHNERSYKSFERELPFPEEVIASKAEAEMKNGVLHVTIPKKEPKKIEETEVTSVNIK